MKQKEAQKLIIEGRELAVAISVDTCIYDRLGLHLEGGLLLRLEQFRGTASMFLVSDVVRRELLKHMEQKALAAGNALRAAVKSAAEHWQAVASTQAEALDSLLRGTLAKDIAKSRLEGFLARCGATMVVADHELKIGPVIDRYFASGPPFDPAGAKKNEFPDAFALMSLENWAQRSSTPIVVVSTDRGWVDFADKSPWLCCIDSLEVALAMFQRRDSTRATLVQRVGDLLEQDSSEVREMFVNRLADVTWWPEASSYFDNDIDLHVQVKSVAFAGDTAGDSMRAVDYRNDELTVVADLVAELEVDADIGFSYDGTSMGGCSISVERTIELEALITFASPASGELDVSEVELVRRNQSIDLGDVVPDESERDPDHERY